MKLPLFLKRKSVWALIVVLGAGGAYAYQRSQAPKGPFYDTQAAAQGPLKQTVEATGQVFPQARINLSFKTGGKLIALPATVGLNVKKGDLLAEVDATDASLAVRRASATVSLAMANLRSREAGETAETIRIAQAAVDQAKANYQKAQDDLAAMQSSVENEYQIALIAVDTAQRNVDNATASNNQTVTNGYASLQTALQNALGPVQTALTDGDSLVGVDNQASASRYALTFGSGDTVSLQSAKIAYSGAKIARERAFQSVHALSGQASFEEVRASAVLVQDALDKTQKYLDFVQRCLATTPESVNFTATEITTKKATIDGDRVAIGAQISAVSSALQTTMNSELARTTNQDQLKNALQTAKTNLMIAESNRVSRVGTARSAVQIQAAALASAQASLDQRRAPPRTVDLAALRAQLQDAQTVYSQAMEQLSNTKIISPVDGAVASVEPKVGEQVLSGSKIIELITNSQFTIEALIPEADIAKVQAGQSAKIVLDAFGEAQPFAGSVIAEYPDQTKVQDAVYYKAIIAIETQGKEVKPGMTANVTILTAERASAIYVPSRAIRQVNGQPAVQVLLNGQLQDRSIVTGLRADEARTEVISGVTVGEQVIIGELTAAEYKAQQALKK